MDWRAGRYQAGFLFIVAFISQITLMDWGNAIIRKKTVDASTGEVTALEADLFLEGDFKKTKKKITWLPANIPLVEVTLLDYDYLITKKKLEEEDGVADDVADFVTPQTEFRVEALADANVAELKKGDTIQFERKGYFIVDAVRGSAEGGDLHLDFITIPDGRAASVASKAAAAGITSAAPATGEKKATSGGWGKGAPAAKTEATAPPPKTTSSPNDKVLLSEVTHGFEIPVTTSMYKVDPVVGTAEAKADTKMYVADSIYQPPK